MAAPKGKKTIKSPGRKPISFQPGGLHKSTGTPQGEPVPQAKMQAAASGKLGPKAKKQAALAKGLLAAGRKTAAKKRGAS